MADGTAGKRASTPDKTGRQEPAAQAPGAAPQPPTRHYRQARRDRGTETRQRLIDAALDVFGRYGFEGATTRQIASEANANLAAIVYHFGGKEGLQVAVAEYLVTRVGTLIGPTLAEIASPETLASPEAARAGLTRMLEAYADVLLGEAEAERWARFIVREQLQPTAAFEVVYGMMGGALASAVRLVAVATGRDPEDESVRLQTITLMGQVMVFRVAHTLVLRRMGWSAIGEAERAAIKRVVAADVRAILDNVVLP